MSPLRQGPVDEKLARRIILVVSAAGLLDGGIWVSAMDSSSYTYNGQHFDIPRSTPQTCYILGLGGCRARDDHAAPRLAGEMCSILANQPQLGLAAADPPESGFVGSVGLGLQYVRVSRADEMRRGVRGRRTEGRFSADRPVHESPQKCGSKKLKLPQ